MLPMLFVIGALLGLLLELYITIKKEKERE
jgi:hypothetical protein